VWLAAHGTGVVPEGVPSAPRTTYLAQRLLGRTRIAVAPQAVVAAMDVTFARR
jgi:hypothetical protein